MKIKKTKIAADLVAAKKLVGIPANVRVTTPTALKKAIEECKRLSIAARRADTSLEGEKKWTPRVAELSKSSGIFKAELARAQERPTNSNARVDVSPEGGFRARWGFGLAPVKEIVAKWSPKLGPNAVAECFDLAAKAIFYKNPLDLNFTPRNRWQAVFELGAALSSVYCNLKRPEAWLMRFPLQVADGETGWDSWQAIADKIKISGGPIFHEKLLAATAKRMGIATSKESAREFRKMMKHLSKPL